MSAIEKIMDDGWMNKIPNGHDLNEAWKEYAALKAERDALKEENDVMYAAILEASELGVSAALRCKVELQRIARNEALNAGAKCES